MRLLMDYELNSIRELNVFKNDLHTQIKYYIVDDKNVCRDFVRVKDILNDLNIVIADADLFCNDYALDNYYCSSIINKFLSDVKYKYPDIVKLFLYEKNEFKRRHNWKFNFNKLFSYESPEFISWFTNWKHQNEKISKCNYFVSNNYKYIFNADWKNQNMADEIFSDEKEELIGFLKINPCIVNIERNEISIVI